MHPADDESEVIKCTLQTCDPEGAPSYECLSYVWGNPEYPREILSEHSGFRVTENLHNALQRLRLAGQTRVLWIDAICINAQDMTERSHQVSGLFNRYSEAERVVFYLGEATAATRTTMDYLSRMRPLAPLASKKTDADFVNEDLLNQGVRDLVSRRFFRRAWIIPEVFHARQAVVLCGSQSVPSEAFARIAEVSHGPVNQQSRAVLENFPGGKRHPPGQSCTKGTLWELMQQFRFTQAANPRDRIYTLALMVDEPSRKERLEIDYSISIEDLMRKVLAYLCFCETTCVPWPEYASMDDFLSHLDPIENRILVTILETSKNLDLESLLQYGSRYIRIDTSLIEAARRNKTRGETMALMLSQAYRTTNESLQNPKPSRPDFAESITPAVITPAADELSQLWSYSEIETSAPPRHLRLKLRTVTSR